MAKVTLVFAVLLAALGVVGYMGSGSRYPTAMIPLYFGVALGVFGILAINPNEGRRKLFMHINVTIGLVGFIGGLVEAILGVHKPVVAGALISAEMSKSLLAALMFIYVVLCVRSFINVRRARAA
jgi:4-hydroxybenzoate polyprenyltransferase